MNLSERISALSDIILSAAETLMDPGSASAQNRATIRTQAHQRLVTSVGAMVAMAHAAESYAVAIEETAFPSTDDPALPCDGSSAAPHSAPTALTASGNLAAAPPEPRYC